MSGATLGGQRTRAHADALLERDYDALKPEIVRTVAAKLAASGVQLPQADLDAVYNQAWHGLHTKLADGEVVENPKGLLVTIAHRRALDEHRAQHPGRRAGEQQLDALVRDDDLDARLDDTTRLRQFVTGLRERLDRRELQAAALCYLYDYSRPEAARLIGVKPKRMEKIMDEVSRKLAPLLGEISAGAWCEQHRSLVTAYALGLLEEDGERERIARDHLADCSSCRRAVLRARGLAAVAPPVPVLALALGAAGAGAAASAAHGGAGRHLLSDPRTKLVAGAVLSALVVVVAALAAAGLFGGDGDSAPPAPPAGAAPDTAAAVRASRVARAQARERAQARARADAGARARTRRIAAARRRRAAASASAAASAAAPVPTTAAQPPAAPAPSPPAPAATPPAATPPAATPPPAAETPAAPAPEPAPAAQPPARDGAEEFDLR